MLFAIVVYKVEKLKHDMQVALAQSLRIFIEPITGCLFKIVQQ